MACAWASDTSASPCPSARLMTTPRGTATPAAAGAGITPSAMATAGADSASRISADGSTVSGSASPPVRAGVQRVPSSRRRAVNRYAPNATAASM